MAASDATPASASRTGLYNAGMPAKTHLSWMQRGAALMALLSGLGFGLPASYGLWHFARYHYVWNFLGFPTHAAGPLLRRAGIFTSEALIAGFVLVCAAEVLMGVLLWQGRPAGRWLALGLLPVELFFWVGLVLPFGPPGGLLRTGLLLWQMAAEKRR